MPWTNEPEFEGGEGREIVSDGVILIATVYSADDAALIAAAPDMLAALERLEAQISATSAYDFACKGDDHELLADVGFARAAIAKAKGN